MPNVPNVNCIVCKDPLSRSYAEEAMMPEGELNDLFMRSGWVCLTGEHPETLGQTRYVCQNCTRAIIEHAPAQMKPKPICIADDFSSNVMDFDYFLYSYIYDGFGDMSESFEIVARNPKGQLTMSGHDCKEVWEKFLEALHGPREIEANVVANVPVVSEPND